MLVCWGMFVGSMALVTISLRGAYGGRPFAKLQDPPGGFWDERYNQIGEKDTRGVGLVLEFSLPLIMWLCVLFLSGLVYRETAARFFTEHLRHWIPYAIASVLLIGVLLYCFVSSPKEHEQLLRDQGSDAFKGLPSDVQRRLQRLRESLVENEKLEEEVGRLSQPYRWYFLYSWNAFMLLPLYLWIMGAGFVGDLDRVISGYRHLDPGVLPDRLGSVSENFLLIGERFYLDFGAYQGSLVQLAIGIVGILGTSGILMYWFLGTRYQTIYTQSAVMIGRQVARSAVVVLPLMILVCYVMFAVTSFEVTSKFDLIAGSIQPEGQTAQHLERFNNLHDRISAASTLESFWSQVVSSSGGLLVLGGIFLSFFQNKERPWSFLNTLAPQGLDLRKSEFINAMTSTKPESDGEGGKAD